MRGYIPQPFDAGGPERRGRIQPFGDRVADERSALALEQANQLAFFGDERLDVRGLAVEIRNYCLLFISRRKCYLCVGDLHSCVMCYGGFVTQNINEASLF